MSLNARQRVLAAWAAVAILTLLVASELLGPLFQQSALYDREIARDFRILEKLLQLDAAREDIEAATRAHSDGNAAALVYPAGMDQNDISLDVQKRVTEILNQTGASVATIAAYTTKEGTYAGAGVKARFSGSLESVSQALHEIETGTPLLLVDELSISPVQNRRRARRNQPAPPAEQVAQIDIAVVAFMPMTTEDLK